MAGDDRNLEWALFDIDNPETLAALLAGRAKNLGLVIMGSDGTKVYPIKVNAEGEMVVNLEVSDIEIGAVELKNADTDERASIEDADTARTTGTKVIAIQLVDATGKVTPAGEAIGNAPFTQITNGTEVADLNSADTARTVNTIVLAIQQIDATGKISPAGEAVGNAPFVKITDGVETAAVNADDELTVSLETAQGVDDAAAPADSVQIAGRYDTSPVERDDGDIATLSTGPFGKVETANHDRSTGQGLVTDLTSVSGVPFTPEAWPQLTAVGATPPVNIKGYKNFGVTVIVASITGDWVDVRVEASRDGTNYVNADRDQGPTGYTRLVANGNYDFDATNRGFTHLRLRLVAEDNAAVTIDGLPFASN